MVLGSINSLLLYKKSSQSFVQIRELLFLHKNNTMVVLLKTTSVQVSFIQIMQIRVQNKSKSVQKSRYDGDISGALKPSASYPRGAADGGGGGIGREEQIWQAS